MNIHYRIVNVDPSAHGIVVRYFTDKVTEMDLANSYNEDGTIKLNADGYPLSTRTDILISIYETPTPSQEDIDRRIKMSAPVDWLKLQEDIKDPEVNTKMTEIRNLTGESKAFTTEELVDIRNSIVAPMSEEDVEQSNTQKAYETVINLVDALKVLAEKDPSIVLELKNVLNS